MGVPFFWAQCSEDHNDIHHVEKLRRICRAGPRWGSRTQFKNPIQHKNQIAFTLKNTALHAKVYVLIQSTSSTCSTNPRTSLQWSSLENSARREGSRLLWKHTLITNLIYMLTRVSKHTDSEMTPPARTFQPWPSQFLTTTSTQTWSDMPCSKFLASFKCTWRKLLRKHTETQISRQSYIEPTPKT